MFRQLVIIEKALLGHNGGIVVKLGRLPDFPLNTWCDNGGGIEHMIHGKCDGPVPWEYVCSFDTFGADAGISPGEWGQYHAYSCWCPGSLDHQQPWYWLCRINGSLSSMRKDFNYLHLVSVEIRNTFFMVFGKFSACKGLRPDWHFTCLPSSIFSSSQFHMHIKRKIKFKKWCWAR